MRSTTCSRSCRASSGSRLAMSSMEPLRSANSTVICLRSPSIALREVRIFSARYFGVYDSGDANRGVSNATEASGVPQPPQNSSPDSFAKPHAAQATANEAPHFVQKRRPSRLSCRHRGHLMLGGLLPRTILGQAQSFEGSSSEQARAHRGEPAQQRRVLAEDRLVPL